MSDKKPLNDLPDSSKTFDIEVTGKVTGKRYVGSFTTKLPSVKTQCLIAKHETFLNGDLAEYLPTGIRQVHERISYLRFCLSESPKWWTQSDLGYELLDVNVIEAVYEKAMEFERDWMKQVWGTEEK